MENSLSVYRELLGRLNRSKSNQRRGSNGGRSASAREAEYQKSQSEYRANQDRYRGDFEIKGGFDPRNAYQQISVGYYNPETGATWSAPNPGYTPKEGTGWVKGYGPKSNKPISSLKEKPPTLSDGFRTADFQDRNGNRIDDRDEPGGSHYQEKPPTMRPGDEKPSYKQMPEKTPTTSSNPALTKTMLNRMASF